jgi:hypothetical protein
VNNPDRRFAAAAVVGTFVVALSLGLVAGLVRLGEGHAPLDLRASGVGAVTGYWAATAGISLLGLAAVFIAGFAVARTDDSMRGRARALLGVGVVAGFPVVLLGAVFVFGLSNVPGGRYTLPTVLVLLLPALAVGGWLGLRRRNALPWTTGLHAALVLALLSGLLVGGAASVPADGLVEEGIDGTPQVAFEATYEPAENGTGVLTVTHENGDAVPADRLRIQFSGAAAVPNATQTESGPWEGETSGGEEPSVSPGDSVRLGVQKDCVVRVVYNDGDRRATLAKFECSAVRESA